MFETIDKGSTWVWEQKFWQDAAKTIPLDVSGHSFSWVVKSISGATVINLTNADFVDQAINHVKVIIPAATTANYTAGIHSFELNVTTPTATIERWQQGFITIEE